VTLQPLRRMPLDGAILFADIMTPLLGAGVPLDIVDGVGPVIESPVRDEAAVRALPALEPERDVPHVLETVRLLRRALDPDVALIGFAGAPFTLASYLIEGRPSRDFVRTKSLMYGAPETWRMLMHRLTELTVAYLRAQISAGVDAVQLFDSWIGALSPEDYARYVQPFMRRIFTSLGPAGVPMIHFGVNTATLLEEISRVTSMIPKTSNVGSRAALPLAGNEPSRRSTIGTGDKAMASNEIMIAAGFLS